MIPDVLHLLLRTAEKHLHLMCNLLSIECLESVQVKLYEIFGGKYGRYTLIHTPGKKVGDYTKKIRKLRLDGDECLFYLRNIPYIFSAEIQEIHNEEGNWRNNPYSDLFFLYYIIFFFILYYIIFFIL